MEDTGTQAPGSASVSVSSETTTLGNASAALAATDSSPVETPTPVDSPAAAITPSAEGEPVSEQSQTAGEPPKWRWQDILANARETTQKETEARIRQEYDWAKDLGGLDTSERQGLLIWNRALRGDTQARSMVAQANQQLAQSLGWAQAPAANPEPEADLQTSDGTPVYSARQQAKREAWLREQLMTDVRKDFDKELAPLKQTAERQQRAESLAQAHMTVSQVLTEFRADPEFKAHEADVKSVLAADQRLSALADQDPKAALEIAYARVFRDKVLPSQRKTSEAQTLAHLQQRAVASTVNPASAAPPSPGSTLGNARASLLSVGVD